MQLLCLVRHFEKTRIFLTKYFHYTPIKNAIFILRTILSDVKRIIFQNFQHSKLLQHIKIPNTIKSPEQRASRERAIFPLFRCARISEIKSYKYMCTGDLKSLR